MKHQEIKCDSCGRDITESRGYPDWRIVVIPERLPLAEDTGTICDVMIYPPIKQEAHFCGTGCLKKWALAL